jgi:hypothetical protein
LATEPAKYLTYTEAVVHHIELMRALGEVRFGILDRALIESAWARPKHAATYDEADLPAQAATYVTGSSKTIHGLGAIRGLRPT